MDADISSATVMPFGANCQWQIDPRRIDNEENKADQQQGHDALEPRPHRAPLESQPPSVVVSFAGRF
jgi:hypothetical protein